MHINQALSQGLTNGSQGAILRYMTKTTKTIDATPTWESLVPVLLYLVRNARTATADIEQELVRMAQAADKWNAHCKETR